MAAYVVDIKDLSGAAVVSDIGVETLEVAENLNAPGNCTIRLPLYASWATASNLAPAQRTVNVTRDGTLRWSGMVWGVEADIVNQTVDLNCEGWYSLFRHRHVDDSVGFNGTEQFNIAWSLINTAQGVTYGNMGITRWGSETPSGVTRKRVYCCYEKTTLADAIEELAFADDGFDFDITPAKVWRAWYPMRGSSKAVTLTTGSGPTDTPNIYNLTTSEDASSLTTEVDVIPDSDDCNDIETIQSSNIATYNLLQAALTTDERIRDTTDRRAAGREYLALWRVPRWTVTVETDVVPWGNYDVGDKITVNAAAGYLTFNREFRVSSWRVSVANGQETVSLDLDSILDATV